VQLLEVGRYGGRSWGMMVAGGYEKLEGEYESVSGSRVVESFKKPIGSFVKN